MPGVDFVISALFETSGLRWEGVCVAALFAASASTTEAIDEKIEYFTALILLRPVECKAAKGRCGDPPLPQSRDDRHCERRLRACALGGSAAFDRFLTSSSSSNNCSFKWRRAAFLIARRSAATASFSAWRSLRVRLSIDCAKCEIFGRRAPTFFSLGFA